MKGTTAVKRAVLFFSVIIVLFLFASCSENIDEITKLQFMGDGVSESKEYTLKQLKEFASNNIYIGSALTSNTSDDETQTSQIEGATLVYILTDIVKLSPGASTVVISASDGFRYEYPIKDLYSREESGTPAVLVWSEDGKAFDSDNGPAICFYDTKDKMWIYGIDAIRVK